MRTQAVSSAKRKNNKLQSARRHDGFDDGSSDDGKSQIVTPVKSLLRVPPNKMARATGAGSSSCLSGARPDPVGDDGKGNGRGRKPRDIHDIVAEQLQLFKDAREGSLFFTSNSSGANNATALKSLRRHLATISSKMATASKSDEKELTRLQKQLQMIESIVKLWNGWQHGHKASIVKAVLTFNSGWQSLQSFLFQEPVVRIESNYAWEFIMTVHAHDVNFTFGAEVHLAKLRERMSFSSDEDAFETQLKLIKVKLGVTLTGNEGDEPQAIVSRFGCVVRELLLPGAFPDAYPSAIQDMLDALSCVVDAKPRVADEAEAKRLQSAIKLLAPGGCAENHLIVTMTRFAAPAAIIKSRAEQAIQTQEEGLALIRRFDDTRKTLQEVLSKKKDMTIEDVDVVLGLDAEIASLSTDDQAWLRAVREEDMQAVDADLCKTAQQVACWFLSKWGQIFKTWAQSNMVKACVYACRALSIAHTGSMRATDLNGFFSKCNARRMRTLTHAHTQCACRAGSVWGGTLCSHTYQRARDPRRH